MKKIVSILIVVLLMLSAVACAQAPASAQAPADTQAPAPAGTQAPGATDTAPTAAPAKKRVFGLTIKTLTNPFFVTVQDAMKGALEPSDQLVVFDANNEIAKQIQQVEDLITQKVDAIFITPIDYRGIRPALERCKEANIPCFLVDSLAEDYNKLCTGSVTSDNVQAGKLAAQALADAIGKKGKIVLYENINSPAVRDRVAGFEAIIKAYPDIEIVGRRNGVGSIDGAVPVMQDFLQAYPDLVGVFAMNDPAAQGCIRVIDSAQKTGKIHVVGIDGSDISKGLIKEGKQLGTAAQFPVKMGQKAISLTYQYLNGEPIENPFIFIPTEWISKDNVDQYPSEPIAPTPSPTK